MPTMSLRHHMANAHKSYVGKPVSSSPRTGIVQRERGWVNRAASFSPRIGLPLRSAGVAGGLSENLPFAPSSLATPGLHPAIAQALRARGVGTGDPGLGRFFKKVGRGVGKGFRGVGRGIAKIKKPLIIAGAVAGSLAIPGVGPVLGSALRFGGKAALTVAKGGLKFGRRIARHAIAAGKGSGHAIARGIEQSREVGRDVGSEAEFSSAGAGGGGQLEREIFASAIESSGTALGLPGFGPGRAGYLADVAAMDVTGRNLNTQADARNFLRQLWRTNFGTEPDPGFMNYWTQKWNEWSQDPYVLQKPEGLGGYFAFRASHADEFVNAGLIEPLPGGEVQVFGDEQRFVGLPAELEEPSAGPTRAQVAAAYADPQIRPWLDAIALDLHQTDYGSLGLIGGGETEQEVILLAFALESGELEEAA